MKKTLFPILLTLCLLSGCNTAVTTTNPDVLPEEENIKLIPKQNPEDEAFDFDNYELLGECHTDFREIENEEVVHLYTSAKRDKKGTLMWDDTQEWLLTFTTDDASYVLFNERIPGTAYMKVLDMYSEQKDTTVINLHVYANTYHEIREYRFNNDAFEERVLYTTDDLADQGISELYSTIPEYK